MAVNRPTTATTSNAPGAWFRSDERPWKRGGRSRSRGQNGVFEKLTASDV